MVLDSSALIAILGDEKEAAAFLQRIEGGDTSLLSTVTYFEASIVLLAREGTRGIVLLDAFLERVGAEIVPVDAAQARIARQAYRRFGKGFHPARLNMGDCFAYALSKETGDALLFKGEDFAQTDVERVT